MMNVEAQYKKYLDNKIAIKAYRKRQLKRIMARYDWNDTEVEWRTTKNGIKFPVNTSDDRIPRDYVFNVKPTKDTKQFQDTFASAKKSLDSSVSWRVSSDYSKEDYDEMDKFIFDEAAFAIHDGDIVSVCVNQKSHLSGSQLIQMAVKNGGTKLDSYDGNWEFYTKNGFEPVSWCKWNDDYASDEWKKTNGFKNDDWKSKSDDDFKVEREDIVFFKYTGNKQRINMTEWKKKVPATDDYDEAYAIRDKSI